ncbi:hypothetical protein SKAU_G00015870 [Synaphobranchus kaupii]|uniref:C2H2-type domain-containing protein n=1 Tax=Synaphobranchus kaupii TaxID=118154 RepID=A0A9Q1GAZ1_SYNKA|nr:hypothetical protein SKAU_G00015870 [Synaphobranchus kaupii]
MAACQNGCGAKKGRKKLYECQVCSSVFNSWDQFKDHLVIHTGEKPNHCTLCDVWFTQPPRPTHSPEGLARHPGQNAAGRGGGDRRGRPRG